MYFLPANSTVTLSLGKRADENTNSLFSYAFFAAASYFCPKKSSTVSGGFLLLMYPLICLKLSSFDKRLAAAFPSMSTTVVPIKSSTVMSVSPLATLISFARLSNSSMYLSAPSNFLDCNKLVAIFCCSRLSAWLGELPRISPILLVPFMRTATSGLPSV